MTEEDYKRRYSDHFTANHRNVGLTGMLRGNVLVYLVFVGTDGRRWSDGKVNRCIKRFRKPLQWLQEQAAKHTVPLTLRMAYGKASVRQRFSPNVGHRLSFPENRKLLTWVAESLGYASFKEMHTQLKQAYRCDEMAVMFVTDCRFRSFTCVVRQPQGEKCAILSQSARFYTIAHELLHLFGAADLYYGNWVRLMATCYLPKSIMQERGGRVIDDMTRFLIGWDDRLSEAAQAFLERTKEETAEKHLRDMQKTGDKG